VGFTPSPSRPLFFSILLSLQLFAQADLAVLAGRFAPERHSAFKQIPAKYVPGKAQYLHAEALAAFLKLARLAEGDGYAIQIVSATRNFTTQKAIWEQKFSGARKVGGKNLATAMPDETGRALEILRFSSMPGTSRHHWGTDMDLHEAGIKGPALTNKTFKNGRGKEFHSWLTKNAPRFGFCQPYTGDPAARNGNKYAHGYQEESWHWSYKPLSSVYLATYKGQAAALKPKGFAGDSQAAAFFLDYVENIDPSCL
jgi:zinc D-Ala-D-Ala carboxypeptidase